MTVTKPFCASPKVKGAFWQVNCVLNNAPTPGTATGNKIGEITDKRGYADHWQFSVRKIDSLLASGLPHLKIGKRRVRINIPEADAWMREQFATQRRSTPAGISDSRITQ
jgi:hypothetical protein